MQGSDEQFWHPTRYQHAQSYRRVQLLGGVDAESGYRPHGVYTYGDFPQQTKWHEIFCELHGCRLEKP